MSPVIVFKYKAAPVSPMESSALDVGGDNGSDADDEQGWGTDCNTEVNISWVLFQHGIEYHYDAFQSANHTRIQCKRIVCYSLLVLV